MKAKKKTAPKKERRKTAREIRAIHAQPPPAKELFQKKYYLRGYKRDAVFAVVMVNQKRWKKESRDADRIVADMQKEFPNWAEVTDWNVKKILKEIGFLDPPKPKPKPKPLATSDAPDQHPRFNALQDYTMNLGEKIATIIIDDISKLDRLTGSMSNSLEDLFERSKRLEDTANRNTENAHTRLQSLEKITQAAEIQTREKGRTLADLVTGHENNRDEIDNLHNLIRQLAPAVNPTDFKTYSDRLTANEIGIKDIRLDLDKLKAKQSQIMDHVVNIRFQQSDQKVPPGVELKFDGHAAPVESRDDSDPPAPR
tara:strand:- start:950 stop:1885 length:936 start_codon:yes stop_codon:yes gene_type:complete